MAKKLVPASPPYDPLKFWVPQATIMVFTEGEYSDYGYIGPFKVLKGFDRRLVVEEFRDQWSGDSRSIRPSDFYSWLAKAGYIEDIDNSMSWHLGEYGGFSPEF